MLLQPMFVAVCTIELSLFEPESLKDKRGVLKWLLSRLHREFNISAAEVALHDAWKAATIGISVVTTSAAHGQNLIDNVLGWIERNRPDVEIVDHYIEIIPFSSASGN